MKYRVHQYVTVRVPTIVEAHSITEAVEEADKQFKPEDVEDGFYAEESLGYTVDPLLENGETDHNNSISCEWRNDVLVDSEGRPVEE